MSVFNLNLRSQRYTHCLDQRGRVVLQTFKEQYSIHNRLSVLLWTLCYIRPCYNTSVGQREACIVRGLSRVATQYMPVFLRYLNEWVECLAINLYHHTLIPSTTCTCTITAFS